MTPPTPSPKTSLCCSYVGQKGWCGGGTVPLCGSLNERAISARCTQLHKCYSFFMACVHNMTRVGDLEVPPKAGKILQIQSKWKTYFG